MYPTDVDTSLIVFEKNYYHMLKVPDVFNEKLKDECHIELQMMDFWGKN